MFWENVVTFMFTKISSTTRCCIALCFKNLFGHLLFYAF